MADLEEPPSFLDLMKHWVDDDMHRIVDFRCLALPILGFQTRFCKTVREVVRKRRYTVD